MSESEDAKKEREKLFTLVPSVLLEVHGSSLHSGQTLSSFSSAIQVTPATLCFSSSRCFTSCVHVLGEK